jgi:glutamate dehydrogenase (NAD(P)+)
LDLPHGGAYGAIRMDKNKYSKREIEFVVRRYTVELAKK